MVCDIRSDSYLTSNNNKIPLITEHLANMMGENGNQKCRDLQVPRGWS